MILVIVRVKVWGFKFNREQIPQIFCKSKLTFRKGASSFKVYL